MQAKHFIIAGAVALGATLGAAETDSITTRDGITYTDAVIQRADPDGVVIEYAPRPGSVGIAKLKFARLPDELQKRYNYNATDALIFEQNHAAGIARRQEEIAQGEIEKKRLYNELLQHRAEEEAAALEAQRQEAAYGVAQMQNGDSYGGWYAIGNRRYRYHSGGPLAGVHPEKRSNGDKVAHWPYANGDMASHYSTGGSATRWPYSTSGLDAQRGGSGYPAPVASYASHGLSRSAARNPITAGRPSLASRAVATGRPAAGGNSGARSFSARSR